MGWSRGWCINLHQPHPQCHLPNHSSVPGPALKCGREAWGAPFSPKTRHFIESPCLAAGKPTTVPRETEAPSPTPFPGLRHSIGVSPAHPCTHPGLEVLGTPLTPKGPSQTHPPPPQGWGGPTPPYTPLRGLCVCVSTLPFSAAKNHGEGGPSAPPSPQQRGWGGPQLLPYPPPKGPLSPPHPKGTLTSLPCPLTKGTRGDPSCLLLPGKGTGGSPTIPSGIGGSLSLPPSPRDRAGPHLEGHIAELALPPDLAHHAVAAAGQIAHREMNQVLRVQLRLGRHRRRRLQHLPDRSRRSPPRFASPAPCPRPATVTRPSHTHPPTPLPPPSASGRDRKR